jgi:hypothetical protein
LLSAIDHAVATHSPWHAAGTAEVHDLAIAGVTAAADTDAKHQHRKLSTSKPHEIKPPADVFSFSRQ